MDIDIEKLTCGIQLTDIERNVLEYLLTHLDQALKLGVRGVARGKLYVHIHSYEAFT